MKSDCVHKETEPKSESRWGGAGRWNRAENPTGSSLLTSQLEDQSSSFLQKSLQSTNVQNMAEAKNNLTFLPRLLISEFIDSFSTIIKATHLMTTRQYGSISAHHDSATAMQGLIFSVFASFHINLQVWFVHEDRITSLVCYQPTALCAVVLMLTLTLRLVRPYLEVFCS